MSWFWLDRNCGWVGSEYSNRAAPGVGSGAASGAADVLPDVDDHSLARGVGRHLAVVLVDAGSQFLDLLAQARERAHGLLFERVP